MSDLRTHVQLQCIYTICPPVAVVLEGRLLYQHVHDTLFINLYVFVIHFVRSKWKFTYFWVQKH